VSNSLELFDDPQQEVYFDESGGSYHSSLKLCGYTGGGGHSGHDDDGYHPQDHADIVHHFRLYRGGRQA